MTLGPLQGCLSPKDGGDLLKHGYDKGINFVDTAELYGTYPHIAASLKGIKREDIVIATKSYAYSATTAEKSLKKAFDEMKVDYIDIFLLHEQESQYTLRGHQEAMEYFIKMKEKGYIKALGISTHHIAAIRDTLTMKEIEVLHPIVNIAGLGIQDGNIDEMLLQLEKAYKAGKGIYGMKPLGGGNLLRSFKECLEFVLDIPLLHSIAIGMKTAKEIDINSSILEKGIDDFTLDEEMLADKALNIAHWCEKCGNCVFACSHEALSIQNDQLKVDYSKCVLCGYCSKYCPHFCIKVV
ncbi:aldo/keto reductase [Alkaliphilus serpentinus]|uniref:aldo/keto reductase n=1 Tax=Alkaliphilus serpentinus TaxID=1482731 RepID=UPI001FAA3EC4